MGSIASVLQWHCLECAHINPTEVSKCLECGAVRSNLRLKDDYTDFSMNLKTDAHNNQCGAQSVCFECRLEEPTSTEW